MAMLSFMRGTWSFISRMFCSRMISGFSAVEMKNPTKERMTLFKRCHINAPFVLRLWALLGRCGGTARASGDRVFRHKRRNRVRDLFLFLLLLEPPAEEALFLFGDLVIVALDFFPLLRDVLIQFRLDLRVLLVGAGFKVSDGPLLNALVTIERLVAANGVLDHILDIHPGGVECHQNGRAFHVCSHGTDMFALEHIGN